ncbi:DUF6090 family protein [Pseudotenacibaculum sp. MALMAid0570]|uniref:DUF6090 family protein n=1 Tax=Pseudotenacibaculum sp. MALMAid0570 TaxID=3143938 RepID=UPI0032DEB9A3
MLKIFRRVRQKLIQQNKVSNYLLYAIGEITLVMIGILLALQVNNWNEVRKTNTQLKSILKTVSLDLERDTIASNRIIRFYDTIKKKSDLIIQKKLNRNNYKDCPECRSLVTIYQPFVIQKKGYELLKDFSNDHQIKTDTLITNITQFYTTFDVLIKDSNAFIKEEVFKNIEFFKTKDWFVDWTLGVYSKEMIVFFTESEEYRKMVAANDILAGKNHKLFVELYRKGANDLLKKIKERLNSDK